MSLTRVSSSIALRYWLVLTRRFFREGRPLVVTEANDVTLLPDPPDEDSYRCDRNET